MSTLVAAAAVGGWLWVDRYGAASEQRDVEALTATAHEFVTLVRGSLPPDWSIERVVEFPAIRPRSQASTEGWDRRSRARANLESAVDKLVPEARQPDLGRWSRWMSNPSWMSRADVLELAHQLRTLDTEIGALRSRVGLGPRPLPLPGTAAPELPRRIALPPLPEDHDLISSRVWTVEPAVVVLRRATSPTCRQRYVWCVLNYVTWVSWDGSIIAEQRVASAPEAVRELELGVANDGTVYTLTLEPKQQLLSAYAPNAEPARVSLTLDDFADQTDYVFGRVETTATGAILATQRSWYQLSSAPAATKLDQRPDTVGVGYQLLDARKGTGAPMALRTGSRLSVRRNQGVVVASVTPDGASEPEAVTRLADFTAANEELMGSLWVMDSGVALEFEGARGSLELLLSSDEGRTWSGAPTGSARP